MQPDLDIQPGQADQRRADRDQRQHRVDAAGERITEDDHRRGTR